MIKNILNSVRPKLWAWLIVAMFLLVISRCSYAQNAGFETGTLSGWTTSGADVSISTGLNNVSYGGGKTWTISPYGTYMGKLYPSGSVSFSSTVSSLGLQAADQTSIQNFLTSHASGGSSNPTNAAWIKTTVALTAGTTYSFAWNYLSTDYVPFNDGSMITLVNANDANILPTLNNSQQRFGLLGFTNVGSGNYSTDSYGSTGWQKATFTVPQDGNYILGFATFNLGDTVLSPMLFIDEIQGTTTLNGSTFGPVAPNPGSNVPSASSPTIVGTSTANNTTTSSSIGTTISTSNSVQTYTVIGTATPTTTVVTTTPVTTTTWSDGSTTTTNGSSSSTSTVSWDYTVTGPATIPVSPYTTSNQNGVYINQINAGSSNVVNAHQKGHGNYENISMGGSNNTINAGQGYTYSTGGIPSESQTTSNYNVLGLSVSGNTNSITNVQLGLSNSSILSATGNTNSSTITQTGNSNQSYGLISGNSNSSTVTQLGNSNISSVNLYGNGNTASVSQTGNSHGAVLNLVNAGGANTVSVIQTGTGDAYSLQQTCTNPAGCSVSIIRNK